MAEKWKPLYFEGLTKEISYKISDLGNIKKKEKDATKWNLVKQTLSRGSYVCFLRSAEKGKQLTLSVHRLVADFFLEKSSPKHKFVAHLDYDKTNNDVENLKWLTQEELIEHQKKEPGYPFNKLSNAKLTIEQVKEIKKRLLDPYVIISELAREFNIGATQIGYIRDGKRWAFVKIDEEETK